MIGKEAADSGSLAVFALTLKGSINANIGATTSVSGKTYDSGRRSGMPVFEAAIEQIARLWSRPDPLRLRRLLR